MSIEYEDMRNITMHFIFSTLFDCHFKFRRNFIDVCRHFHFFHIIVECKHSTMYCISSFLFMQRYNSYCNRITHTQKINMFITPFQTILSDYVKLKVVLNFIYFILFLYCFFFLNSIFPLAAFCIFYLKKLYVIQYTLQDVHKIMTFELRT